MSGCSRRAPIHGTVSRSTSRLCFRTTRDIPFVAEPDTSDLPCSMYEKVPWYEVYRSKGIVGKQRRGPELGLTSHVITSRIR